MISFPNNILFRFRKSDGDAQVILGTKDFKKMIKVFSSKTQVSKEIAKTFLVQSFYDEITRVYGKPSKITLILDDTASVVH